MSPDQKPTRAWLLAEVRRLRALNRALCRAPKGRKRGQSALLIEVGVATHVKHGFSVLVADAKGNEMRELKVAASVVEQIGKDFQVKMRPVSYDPGPDLSPPTSGGEVL